MDKIFDSHFHIWDSSVPIAWLKDNDRLYRDFSFMDLCAEYDCANSFIGGLYIESASLDCNKELAYVLNQDIGNRILGLCVSDIDMLHADSHILAKIHSFREILHVDLKGSARCKEVDFLENMHILRDADIPFEACMKTQEIGDLAYLLENIKGLRIILNHMGSPTIENLSSYKDAIANLSRYENLFIKLSSPDYFSLQISIDFIYDIFRILYGNFGSERIIFGSNFPVSFLKPLEWARIIEKSNIFAEIDNVFYKNAFNFYKIKDFKI